MSNLQHVFGPFATSKAIIIKEHQGTFLPFLTYRTVDVGSITLGELNDPAITIHKLPPSNVLGIKVSVTSVHILGQPSKVKVVLKMDQIPVGAFITTAEALGTDDPEEECDFIGCAGSAPCDPVTEESCCENGVVACVTKPPPKDKLPDEE